MSAPTSRSRKAAFKILKDYTPPSEVLWWAALVIQEEVDRAVTEATRERIANAHFGPKMLSVREWIKTSNGYTFTIEDVMKACGVVRSTVLSNLSTFRTANRLEQVADNMYRYTGPEVTHLVGEPVVTT